MSVVARNPAQAFAQEKDEAQIKTIIETVGTLADTGNFESLEKLYAPEVEMDYTSLAGGQVALKSPQTIMTEWAGILPGFDCTRHAVSQIQVSSNGETATATANVTADHWVNDMHWQVTGTYLYRLVKEQGGWYITAHQFNLKGEQGSRDVFGPAIEKAESKPVSYLLRQQHQQVVQDFLLSLADQDLAKCADLWAEDIIQDLSFSPAGSAQQITGLGNLRAYYGDLFAKTEKNQWTSGLVFYPLQNPEMVLAKFNVSTSALFSSAEVKTDSYGLFYIEKGKIKLIRQFSA